MRPDSPVDFLIRYPDPRAELVDLIRQFLADRSDLGAFERRFSDLYLSTPRGSLSRSDDELLGEILERVQFTDEESPAHPELDDPREFESWLSAALARLVD